MDKEPTWPRGKAYPEPPLVPDTLEFLARWTQAYFQALKGPTAPLALVPLGPMCGECGWNADVVGGHAHRCARKTLVLGDATRGDNERMVYHGTGTLLRLRI